MWHKIKDFLEFSSKNGLFLPSAYDASRDEASTTLLSFYIGISISVLSLISYHFMPDKLVGPTSMSLLFLVMTFVFYRLRNLDKVKFDLKNQSLELEDEPDITTDKDIKDNEPETK